MISAMRSSATDFSEEACLHFPKTIRFLKELPFESIGRVVLLGVSPWQKVYHHSDYMPEERRSDCLLTTFQPQGQCKEYFILNREKKIFQAPSQGFFFDDTYEHFMPAKPNFAYTIRVDGTFKDSVKTAHYQKIVTN